MPEYAKMKNADLEALLKDRGLQTGGKKADMVERLTKDDDDKQTPNATAGAEATTRPAVHPEDEIDWDDDEDVPAATSTTNATEATGATAAVVEKAGGEGAVGNPQAVPNQIADIDPSTTADLSVKSPGEAETSATGNAPAAEEKTEPPPDFTRGLAASSLDEEIEKRKARAKKFGLNIEDDEGLKKLERAKKYGETGPPKGLDEALPERNRKRGRDNHDEGGRARDKRRGGGRFGGRRERGNDDQRRDDRGHRDNRRDDKSRGAGGTSNWMTEADRAKAEARKAKFAKPSSAA